MGWRRIVRSSKCFCLIEIFHCEKQQHFIRVVGVAEKMFLLSSGRLPRWQVRIIDRFPFSEISDFVTN